MTSRYINCSRVSNVETKYAKFHVTLIVLVVVNVSLRD